MKPLNLTPADKARAAARAIEFGLDGHTFDMSDYCGSACCVAGHIAAIAGYKQVDDFIQNVREITRIAAAELGLKYMLAGGGFLDIKCEAGKMFNPTYSTSGVSYDDIKDPKWAANMLDHWANTLESTGKGEIDWINTKPSNK